MEVTDFTIKLTVSQPRLDVDGKAGSPSSESSIHAEISQPRLEVIYDTCYSVTETMLVTFGKWIKGDKGDNGLSSYQVWLAMGHTGTVCDYFNWLRTYETATNEEIDDLFEDNAETV
jgi:hypothetical protein